MQINIWPSRMLFFFTIKAMLQFLKKCLLGHNNHLNFKIQIISLLSFVRWLCLIFFPACLLINEEHILRSRQKYNYNSICIKQKKIGEYGSFHGNKSWRNISGNEYYKGSLSVASAELIVETPEYKALLQIQIFLKDHSRNMFLKRYVKLTREKWGNLKRKQSDSLVILMHPGNGLTIFNDLCPVTW